MLRISTALEKLPKEQGKALKNAAVSIEQRTGANMRYLADTKHMLRVIESADLLPPYLPMPHDVFSRRGCEKKLISIADYLCLTWKPIGEFLDVSQPDAKEVVLTSLLECIYSAENTGAREHEFYDIALAIVMPDKDRPHHRKEHTEAFRRLA